MDDETLLHRQVHPAFVQGNSISEQVFQITSQVFKPTEKDEGLLSVYNGNKFTAEESYEHYVSSTEFESIGVVSVSKEECNDASLTVVEDNDPFDGHSSIDFNGLSQNQISKKAKLLKSKAMDRGWQFINEPPADNRVDGREQ